MFFCLQSSRAPSPLNVSHSQSVTSPWVLIISCKNNLNLNCLRSLSIWRLWTSTSSPRRALFLQKPWRRKESVRTVSLRVKLTSQRVHYRKGCTGLERCAREWEGRFDLHPVLIYASIIIPIPSKLALHCNCTRMNVEFNYWSIELLSFSMMNFPWVPVSTIVVENDYDTLSDLTRGEICVLQWRTVAEFYEISLDWQIRKHLEYNGIFDCKVIESLAFCRQAACVSRIHKSVY